MDVRAPEARQEFANGSFAKNSRIDRDIPDSNDQGYGTLTMRGYDAADRATPNERAHEHASLAGWCLADRADRGLAGDNDAARKGANHDDRRAERNDEQPTDDRQYGQRTRHQHRYDDQRYDDQRSAVGQPCFDRRHLYSGNDGDLLQRRRRSEHERLWVLGRRRKRRRRIEWRFRNGQCLRVGRRRRQHVVDPDLRRLSVGQRIVQLNSSALARDDFRFDRSAF